jgi:hypothetical protein
MSLGFWCELHWTYGLLIGSIAIFSMLILPIHEHGRSFHFLLSFRWCLSSVICSFPCRVHLHSLLSLFQGIWFLFKAIVNGIVFLHYFSKLFIVDVQKGYWFCKLILYLPTLLKLFMVSRSFWAEFFQSLKYRIMLSTNRDNLTISLPTCIPFPCLIALAKNSRTMLSKSGESRHFCLVPYFSGNGFSFSPLSMMLAI